eukprot:128046_1
MQRHKAKPFIGINLGTVYSSVGVWKNGEFIIIPNSAGQTRIPFNDSLDYKIFNGYSQRNHNTTHAFNLNSLLGNQCDSPFHITKDNSKNRPMIEVDCFNETKRFHPQEIVAMILSNLKSISESYIEEPIENCVISIPSHFTNGQRQAIKDAGQIIGLNVLRLIPETTAAAVAYGSTDDGVYSIVFV